MEFGLRLEDVDVGDGLIAVNDGVNVGYLGVADDLMVIVQHAHECFIVIGQ